MAGGQVRLSKSTPEKVVPAIWQVEAGTVDGEVCRKIVTETAVYRWQKTYA